MRIAQSSRIGYAPILLIFNRSLQKQRAKKADQRISPRRALKAIIAIQPPVSVFEIHAATGREVYTSFHPISTIFLPLVSKFLKVFEYFLLNLKSKRYYLKWRYLFPCLKYQLWVLLRHFLQSSLCPRHYCNLPSKNSRSSTMTI